MSSDQPPWGVVAAVAFGIEGWNGVSGARGTGITDCVPTAVVAVERNRLGRQPRPHCRVSQRTPSLALSNGNASQQRKRPAALRRPTESTNSQLIDVSRRALLSTRLTVISAVLDEKGVGGTLVCAADVVFCVSDQVDAATRTHRDIPRDAPCVSVEWFGPKQRATS